MDKDFKSSETKHSKLIANIADIIDNDMFVKIINPLVSIPNT